MKYTHSELVNRAEKWLKSFGCSVVICEMACFNGTGEIPDAIGFKSGFSILVECKTSKSDFRADHKKIFRREPYLGMGDFRVFMCEDGLLDKNDLPEGWGLVTVSETRKTVKREKFFKGNCIQREPLKRFETCYTSERALLVSALRRKEEENVKLETIIDEQDIMLEAADSTINKLERMAK